MRLRKSDRELLALIDTAVADGELDWTSKTFKAWSSFYDRVLADELKGGTKKVSGLSVRRAIEVLQATMGRRCVLPAGFPKVAPTWFITLQNRINASGLTEALLKQAAEAALVEWRGLIKAESVIRQADVLLAGEGGPLQLRDEGTDMEDL